jgi:hypothetical protein
LKLRTSQMVSCFWSSVPAWSRFVSPNLTCPITCQGSSWSQPLPFQHLLQMFSIGKDRLPKHDSQTPPQRQSLPIPGIRVTTGWVLSWVSATDHRFQSVATNLNPVLTL